MNRKCLKDGEIQQLLDGEMSNEARIEAAGHLESCSACAQAFALAELESSQLNELFSREFDSLVPTQRLWQKISSQIEANNNKTTLLGKFRNFVSSALNPQFAFASAALIVLLSGLYLLSFNSGLNLAFDDNKGAFETSRQPSKASQTENTRTGAVPSASDPLNSGQIALSQNSQPAEQNNDQFQAPLADNSMPDSVNQVASSRSVDQNTASKTRYIKAGYRTGANPVAENLPNSNSAAESEYLPSERTFLKTISDLEKSSSQKLSEMSPAEQFAFQRDMAVINDSITRLKGVLKKNPQNRSARQILYTAYQDKIDLLNSAAQRNELVATIK